METPSQQSHESPVGAVIESSARRITVYANSLGDIVIRQAANGYGEKPVDDVIVVRQASVPSLLDALAAESQLARSAVSASF